MIGQTRAVLDAYAANGGSYREVALEDCGHSPHLEHPDVGRGPRSWSTSAGRARLTSASMPACSCGMIISDSGFISTLRRIRPVGTSTSRRWPRGASAAPSTV